MVDFCNRREGIVRIIKRYRRCEYRKKSIIYYIQILYYIILLYIILYYIVRSPHLRAEARLYKQTKKSYII